MLDLSRADILYASMARGDTMPLMLVLALFLVAGLLGEWYATRLFSGCDGRKRLLIGLCAVIAWVLVYTALFWGFGNRTPLAIVAARDYFWETLVALCMIHALTRLRHLCSPTSGDGVARSGTHADGNALGNL
jgi:hypothetical protein